VEAVDAEHQAGTAKALAYPRHAIGGLGARGGGAELRDVDADREGADAHLAAFPPHRLAAVVDLRPEQPLAAAEEVAGILPGVEADEVGTKQPLEHLAAPGESAEHLLGGEGDVEEEGDRAAVPPPLADL